MSRPPIVGGGVGNAKLQPRPRPVAGPSLGDHRGAEVAPEPARGRERREQVARAAPQLEHAFTRGDVMAEMRAELRVKGMLQAAGVRIVGGDPVEVLAQVGVGAHGGLPVVAPGGGRGGRRQGGLMRRGRKG